MKKKIKHFDRLLLIPIIGISVSVFIMILISFKSQNDIIFWPPYFSYKGFNNFLTIYKFPLNLSLIMITAWGILVTYKTYNQTKEQFLLLNYAWLKTEPKLLLIPLDNKKQVNKLLIPFEIENTGNTSAENFEINISVTADRIELDIPQPTYIPKFIYPHHAYTALIEIGNTFSECKDMYKTKPTIFIDITMSYITLNKIKFILNEKYAYEYGKLIRFIDSNVDKVYL